MCDEILYKKNWFEFLGFENQNNRIYTLKLWNSLLVNVSSENNDKSCFYYLFNQKENFKKMFYCVTAHHTIYK